MTLNEMKAGHVAIITGYGVGNETIDTATARQYRTKLLALGLTRGTKVRFVSQAPLGDPIEIDVRGFHLTLRKDEATVIKIRRIEG